jgi:hypothetical protein
MVSLKKLCWLTGVVGAWAIAPAAQAKQDDTAAAETRTEERRVEEKRVDETRPVETRTETRTTEERVIPEKTVRIGEGAPRGTNPPSHVEPPPAPPAPNMELPEGGVHKEAGVGSQVAYSRAGVLELGGSGGFSAASNYTRFELSPSIGWFLVDNVELSALMAWDYFHVASTSTSPATSATEFKLLAEPSFHLPFSEELFGFLGLGAGVNYITDQQVGFALQPRIGANILVGRSGLLTPSFNVAYSTTNAIRTEAGTLLAVRTSYGLNIGYTVMW